MRKILPCGALLAALVMALTPAGAGASGKKLFPCATRGAVPTTVLDIRARGISCENARKVIRSVEAHRQFCHPSREAAATIAPYRICDAQAVLSTGARSFHCVAQFINSRFYREKCSASGGTRVYYRRDDNATR